MTGPLARSESLTWEQGPKEPRAQGFGTGGPPQQASEGVPTFIDPVHKVAHNEVMVIDRQTIVTGSFNFTRSAAEGNAENLLVIKLRPGASPAVHSQLERASWALWAIYSPLMYHQLRAAQGFLELGDPDSALEELESIPAEDRSHPIALQLRVYIYREKMKWMEMAEISRHLTEIEPEQPEHWTNRAWAERRHLGVLVAEKTLLQALARFPNEGILYYNLSCYAAVDGRTVEAKSLLSKAIELDPAFKGLALKDEDLVGVS